MNEMKIIKRWTLITKIFVIGLLIQFFVQTFVTYRLGLSGGIWSVLRMWKEIVLIGLIGFLGIFLRKRKIRQARRHTLPIKKFVIWTGIAIGIALLVSLLINQSGLAITIMSLRYSMTGFIIFIVFFALAYLFFWTKEINLVKRYAHAIKTLLVLSIIRRGVIWLIPNLLKFAGYNQYNYEWGMDVAPPAAYYTQYDSGYVRNQFVFERPISRGFFLIAFWPLFFLLCIKNKPRSEKMLRSGLYGIALLSTFSRAAWIARIVQIVILILLQMQRKHRKIALRSFVPLLALFAGVTYVGRDQIINRQFSNTGHFRLVVNALTKIGERPIRGQGAWFAGPASHFLPEGQAYNPENQYLQIRLEYGILGLGAWLYLYVYLHLIGYQAYRKEKELEHKQHKQTKNYGILVFAFSLGILGLSIEGLVLHSFVDRMIVYPLMALFGITYALYTKSLNK